MTEMESESTEPVSTPSVRAGTPARLRDLGHDEIWLQNWLAEDPQRIGLGAVNVIAQELTQARGGSLDILAADGDTYYSIEVQLGEIDAHHGFRVFDYWARNQERYANKTHIAVLVAESAGGRYSTALAANRVLAAYRGRAESIARGRRGPDRPRGRSQQPQLGRGNGGSVGHGPYRS